MLAVAVAADDAEKVLAKLEGTWTLVELQKSNGEKLTGRDLAGVKPLAIKGKEWCNPQGEGSSGARVLGNHPGGTLTIDPAKDPAHIDLACTDGFPKGSTQAGIVLLDGDTLKICVGSTKRPSAFEGKDGQALHVYRRERKCPARPGTFIPSGLNHDTTGGPSDDRAGEPRRD